jgi:hypothetical protein
VETEVLGLTAPHPDSTQWNEESGGGVVNLVCTSQIRLTICRRFPIRV